MRRSSTIWRLVSCLVGSLVSLVRFHLSWRLEATGFPVHLPSDSYSGFHLGHKRRTRFVPWLTPHRFLLYHVLFYCWPLSLSLSLSLGRFLLQQCELVEWQMIGRMNRDESGRVSGENHQPGAWFVPFSSFIYVLPVLDVHFYVFLLKLPPAAGRNFNLFPITAVRSLLISCYYCLCY